jgi:hypothetical protein
VDDEGWGFTARPWRWDARSESWVFVSLPQGVSDEVAEHADGGAPRGFGSVRVEVRCGTTTWRTSVFPDTARGCYVLPLKAAVRRAESVEVDREVRLHLRLL